MKKLLSVMLAGAMAFSLTACGGSGEQATSAVDETTTANEPVKIKIWYETQDAIAETLQAELDQLKPEVEVTHERKDKITEALKLVGNDPNNAPDMYFFANDKTGVYAEMGILSPITDFIDKSELDDMIPMTVDACTYKDEIYELPIYFESLLFLYNKDLMDEAPKTTDDLLAYMEEHTGDDHYGFVEQHSTAYFSVGWVNAFGGYIINEKAEPGLDTEGTIEALEYHKQFVPFMPIDGDYNTMTSLFQDGKADSTIAGPWMIPDLKTAGINYGIAPMPVIEEAGQAISPFAGIQGVCVLKVAETKKEAVKKVLETLAKPNIGIELANVISAAPANKLCYDNEDVKSNEIVMALSETAKTAVPMPNVPEMDVMWAITENLLSDVNKAGADVTTACEEAQKEALAQIEAMK